MIALLVGFLLLGGPVGERSHLETVELYRAALNNHDIETAMSFLAEEYKLRFVGTEFVMSKADLPPILGWDSGVNGHVDSWDSLFLERYFKVLPPGFLIALNPTTRLTLVLIAL